MYIKMSGLYGLDHNAWYQKVGDGCFQFVNDKRFASDMSETECQKVLEHGEFYLNGYNADMISITD